MKRWAGRLLVLCALLAGAPAGLALAQTAAAPPASAPVTITSTCATYAGITNRIVNCARDAIANAADAFISGCLDVVNQTGACNTTSVPPLYAFLSRAVQAALTLAVILYGGLMAFGAVEKLGRDSIMLLLKIATVSYFVAHSGAIYYTITGLMDDASAAVVSGIPTTGNISTDPSQPPYDAIACVQQLAKAQSQAGAGGKNGPPVTGPWIGIDCVLDTMIGIQATNSNGVTLGADQQALLDNMKDPKAYDGDQGVARGLFYLIFSNMTSSVMGFLTGLIMAMFVWGMLMLLVKIMFIYLAAYIGIALLTIVSPLFLPLCLFQSTRNYFDKWVGMLVSFALQPVIMLVFVVFAITAVDLSVSSGDYSIIYRIAGDASRQNGFSLNRYLTEERDLGDGKKGSIITKEPLNLSLNKSDAKATTFNDTVDNKGVIKGIAQSVCTGDLSTLSPEQKKLCDQFYPTFVKLDAINWDVMAQVRQPPVDVAEGGDAAKAIAGEVLAAVIFAGIVVFVLNGILRIVPTIAYDLTGDFGQSANLASVGGTLPGQAQLRAALSQRPGGGGG